MEWGVGGLESEAVFARDCLFGVCEKAPNAPTFLRLLSIIVGTRNTPVAEVYVKRVLTYVLDSFSKGHCRSREGTD